MLSRGGNRNPASVIVLILARPKVRCDIGMGANMLIGDGNQCQAPRLEHAPKKLLGFFETKMLQLFESKRFLFDQMIPPVGQEL
jgi:hypothetical protein